MLRSLVAPTSRLAITATSAASRFEPLVLLRHYATAPAASPVVAQLRDIHEMLKKVETTNSKPIKQTYIVRYPQLRELLETIYDPHFRVHLTPSNLLKREDIELDPEHSDQVPNTILELLQALSTKTIRGNLAKDVTNEFFRRHVTREEVGMPDWYDYRALFLRILDRNLTGGFGARTLSGIMWPAEAAPTTPTNGSAASAPTVKVPSAGGQSRLASSSASGPNLDRFECALGKAITAPFTELRKVSQEWYASRKLDGVRVLALLDFVVPDAGGEIQFKAAQFVSRSGHPFVSLGQLKRQLVHLAKFPGLRARLDLDPEIIEEVEGGVVKRLVLDGEVCALVAADEAKGANTRIKDDGTGAAALWEDIGVVENFSLAVREVKRHAEMANPAYFLFDSLSWAEVDAKVARPDVPGLGKTFGARVPETKALTDWLRDHLKEQGVETKIRALVQWPMKVGDEDAMMQRCADESWEGLIFRADLPYKGKRSPAIRKFKTWLDAEYTVVDMDTGTMRLPVDGVFGQHEAMANVWIEHKGHRVSIGSGFTPAERIAFFQDPSQIVGHQITVEYFAESEAADRPGVKSLRFPRVKAIWGAARDI